MINALTIQRKMDEAGGFTSGFDYLRIGLSLFILCWHSIWLSTGSIALDHGLWSGDFRFIPAAVLPMFFALSGFLVAGSLVRTKLHQFLVLRVIRLIPALAVEIMLSAILLGLIFTDMPIKQYLMDKKFWQYFLNIVGLIHFELPGVFVHNIGSSTVNAQLWTIPFELQSYTALLGLSILTFFKRRLWFLLVVIAFSVALMVSALTSAPVIATAHLPGRMLVLSFLTAVSVFLYRDVIPYNTPLGIISLIAAVVFLEIPCTTYLAAFPVAYITVWLGLMSPPKIRFGDLSYGVFLFHFPIEQTVMHLVPSIHMWWQLSLISLPLALGCAWLSWNLIENPILSRKKSILAAVDRGLLTSLQFLITYITRK